MGQLPVVIVSCMVLTATAWPAKQESVLFPATLVETLRANATADPWVKAVAENVVAAAQPWMQMSDDQLWQSVFGPAPDRSWMVLSDGDCPACHQPVPMYNWKMDALHRPWKVQCPHCQELFPKNDYAAFHTSGLNQQGVFDPALADRSLLFNAEHPDPSDPLHAFGVDDGFGFTQGERCWRFIGAYLIYGQWYQVVLDGAIKLSQAYLVTGDPAYAHKTAVLLDRIADVYPSFDYKTQGYTYEKKFNEGYVTVWHNACEDTMNLAMAYDRIRPALRNDSALVGFLLAKARRGGLANPKTTIEDIQRNIEAGILIDPIAHQPKIHCNYPKKDITVAVLKTVLDWPANRDDVTAMIDEMITQATAVDGVTGEKGLAGYSYYTLQALAEFLQQYTQVLPDLLPQLLARHPRLMQTWRFHLDTWCLDSYYPLVGDCGVFARKEPRYLGLGWALLEPDEKTGTVLPSAARLRPSMYSFLWALYQASGDVDYVRLMWRANRDSAAGLPYDIYCLNPQQLQQQVQQVIARHGPQITLPSVNKRQWRLGILRSGQGDDRRALWLDYDVGGPHGHADGLNLGLFAKGLDLLPDLGYPPVQRGGWGSDWGLWYERTGSHNTVVVNGKSQKAAAGQCLLWADGQDFHAIAAQISGVYKGVAAYARAAAMVDVSPRDFYVLDVFRVAGGKDHLKLTHSLGGTVQTTGLDMQPMEGFFGGQQMREFSGDGAAPPGWEAVWDLDDRWGYLPAGRKVRLQYIDLTEGAAAGLARTWVSPSLYDTVEDLWIPRVWVRRTSNDAHMESLFVSVLQAYEDQPIVASARRLEVSCQDGAAAPTAAGVEVCLADGRRDVLLVDLAVEPEAATAATAPAGQPGPATTARDTQPAPASQPATRRPGVLWGAAARGLWLDGRAAWVRYGADGRIERLALAGRSIQTPQGSLDAGASAEFVEAMAEAHGFSIVVRQSPQPDELPPR